MKRPAATLAAVALVAPLLASCVSSGERSRPARAAQTSASSGYVVRPGDTLLGIAGRLGVGMNALASANGLAPPYLIRVGQRLTVPRPSPAPIRTVSRPVVQPLPREPERREAERRDPYASTPAPRPTNAPSPAIIGSAPRLAWPADGPVSASFGSGSDPGGLTFAAHKGAAVRAAAGGKVLFAGAEPARYGQLVLIDHGGGWVSAYAYLSRIVVREGETVRSGGRIGFVGTNGASNQAQLYFELRRDNTAVDPGPLLPPRF